jgi:hypothetical protein
MKNLIITTSLVLGLTQLTGCMSAGRIAGATVGAGTAGMIAKSAGASDSVIILSSAIGAGIGVAGADYMQKKDAEEKARIFEEGQRYARAVMAREQWYNATLMPDLNQNANQNTYNSSISVPILLPATTQNGMHLAPRMSNEQILP